MDGETKGGQDMATVLVLDTKKDEIRIAECDKLNDFYREIGAEPFDIARHSIGGRTYDIYVDDMGLFKEPITVSAINNRKLEPMLVGNLVFANHDNAGNTTSLTGFDMATILNNIVRVYTTDEESHLAVMCEY